MRYVYVVMMVAVLACLAGCHPGPRTADDPNAIQAFIVHHGEPPEVGAVSICRALGVEPGGPWSGRFNVTSDNTAG